MVKEGKRAGTHLDVGRESRAATTGLNLANLRRATRFARLKKAQTNEPSKEGGELSERKKVEVSFCGLTPMASTTTPLPHLPCGPASRWLAEWLLENNPNKPTIAHADDQRTGGDADEGREATAVGENKVMGMVATVESRLQE